LTKTAKIDSGLVTFKIGSNLSEKNKIIVRISIISNLGKLDLVLFSISKTSFSELNTFYKLPNSSLAAKFGLNFNQIP